MSRIAAIALPLSIGAAFGAWEAGTRTGDDDIRTRSLQIGVPLLTASAGLALIRRTPTTNGISLLAAGAGIAELIGAAVSRNAEPKSSVPSAVDVLEHNGDGTLTSDEASPTGNGSMTSFVDADGNPTDREHATGARRLDVDADGKRVGETIGRFVDPSK